MNFIKWFSDMVIPEKKIIFLHIGKTAGTTIERLLFKKHYGVSFKLDPMTPNYDYMFGYDLKKHGVFLQHADLKLFKQIGYDLENYYTFTVVRNPYDRLFSAYMNLMGNFFNKNRNLKSEVVSNMFNEFVCNDLEEKYLANSEYSVNHFAPMVNYTNLEDYQINDIFRYENINEDLDFLDFKSSNGRPFKTHASVYFKDYLDAYSPKSIELVNDLYKDDFDKLDYNTI